MNTRTPHTGTVVERTRLDEHLVRIVLGECDLTTSGTPDEWFGLVVPGQFQSRYYTVRSLEDGVLTFDVVIHSEGLVTGWAQSDCIGDVVGLSVPRGSFGPPPDAAWVMLAGDLTALPAMARILEWNGVTRELPVSVHAEAPHPVAGYLPASTHWHRAAPGASALSQIVRDLEWPPGPGYFWMGGESAQMRDIRRHLRHDLGREHRSFEVMGYWSGSRGRQRRAVDPGPVYARGKAEGKSDGEIWAAYDAAREDA